MAYQAIFRAASVAAGRGVKTIGKTGMTLGQGAYRYRGPIAAGTIKPVYKAGRFALRNLGPIATAGFVGYEAYQGKDLGEAVVRGGAEGVSLGVATAAFTVGSAAGGALAGATVGSVIPGLGTAAGFVVGAVAGYFGYTGTRNLMNLGFGKKEAPFEQVYGNRRAITMRQASKMVMARTRRPIGNEAQSMHLR